MNETLRTKQLEILKNIQSVKKGGEAYAEHCLALYRILMGRQRIILRQLIIHGSRPLSRFDSIPDAIESLEKLGLIVRVAFRQKFDHIAVNELGFEVGEKYRILMAKNHEKIMIGADR